MEQGQKRMKESALAQYHFNKRAGKQLQGPRPEGVNSLKEEVQELRLTCEKAMEANRAKAEFIGTLTHELRLPIHVIVGCADLLLDGAWGMLQGEQKAIVLKVRQNACYLFDLISDLMELDRVDGGKGVARCEEIDVQRFVEEVEAMTQFMPKAEGVLLQLKISPELPPLFSDRDKLKIILRNLVGNAIKFTQKGQITVGADFDPKAQMIKLSVRDAGIGIEAKDQQRIFDAFWQGEDSRARPFGGVGLGLYIVKRLADQLGAKIKVKSERGKGSLFCLKIPLRPD